MVAKARGLRNERRNEEVVTATIVPDAELFQHAIDLLAVSMGYAEKAQGLSSLSRVRGFRVLILSALAPP